MKASAAVLSRWDAIVQIYGQIAPRLDNLLNRQHSIGLTDFLALRDNICVRTHMSRGMGLKASAAVLSRWDAIVQIYGQIAPRLDNLLNRQHSIGLTDFLALRAIARNWEPHMRIQQLAAELGLSHSAASRLVGKLEKANILGRYECSADRRGTYTELTGVGRAVLAKAETTYSAAVSEMMSATVAAELLERVIG